VEAKVVLRDVLLDGTKRLKESNIEAPAVEAGAILCHVLGCNRTYLYSHDDYILDDEQYTRYMLLLDERLEGRPVQYITGHQEFMSLDFIVTPHVLIPRQDTEILVEEVIEYAKGIKGDKIEILDIGTGSGCIAVSLAHYISKSRVSALDVSLQALKIAHANATNNNVDPKITFLLGDVFGGLENINGRVLFDIIVSNPPYIPSNDISTLEKQVKDYEPYCALDGGKDGLIFYRRIVEQSISYLKPGGLLAFEVGIGQAQDVKGIMDNSFNNLKIVKDLAGIDRVVMGNFNP
jgi:release factor glutamine methyltransferase